MPPLQWKGAPAPRAKPIPQEIWERHREELCAMYQNYTLDNLMAMMKVTHNFHASRRQYVSQFERWGTHKYKVSNKDNVQPSPGQQHQHVQFPEAPQIKGSLPDAGATSQYVPFNKRQRSLRDSALIPAKRQVLSDYRSPDVSVTQSEDEAHSALNTNSSTEDSLSPEGTADAIYRSPAATITDDNHLEFENFDAAFFLKNDDTEPVLAKANTPEEAVIKEQTPESSYNALIHEIFQRWANRQDSDCRNTQSDALFDINRPIDTFSSEEMDKMHHAADFLFALNFRKDAFPLYVLILKRLKMSSRKYVGATSSALVACVRSAVLSNQAAIARNLLQQQLDQPDTAIIEQFTFQFLLADTYKRFRDFTTAGTHIRSAMQSHPFEESLIEDLPHDYRSLDFATYHFIIDGINHTKLRNSNEPFPPNYFSLEKSQVEDQITRRKPGPFELEYGTLKNSCIRSCLDWCAGILEPRTLIPGLWDTVQANHDGSQLNEDKSDSTRLYCYLWQRWHATPPSQISQDLDTWTQAETLMGISAAEHLVIICPMILKAAPAKTDYSQGARLGINILRRKTDEDLCFQYLDTFCRRYKWLLDTDGDEILALSTPPEGTADKSRPLSLMLSHPPNSARPETIAAQTMASSMVSSDLSSFRNLRDRIRQKMTKTDTATKRSSQVTSQSIDQLSTSMSSSLSLYSHREEPYNTENTGI